MRKNLAVRALASVFPMLVDSRNDVVSDELPSAQRKNKSYRPTPTFFGSGVSLRLFGERVYSRQMKIHAKRRNKVAFG